MSAVGEFGDARYRKIDIPRPRATEDVLAWGTMHSADFSEKTLELRIEGNMPRVGAGRYAIIEADKLRMIVMQANAWRKQQSAGKSA